MITLFGKHFDVAKLGYAFAVTLFICLIGSLIYLLLSVLGILQSAVTFRQEQMDIIKSYLIEME